MLTLQIYKKLGHQAVQLIAGKFVTLKDLVSISMWMKTSVRLNNLRDLGSCFRRIREVQQQFSFMRLVI